MTNYPRFAYISAISKAKNSVVTFTEDHDFTEGELIAFRVGAPFGMFQINQKVGRILTTTSDTVTTNIDTSDWGTFSLTNLNEPNTTPPVCVPSASGVVPSTYFQKTNLKDAFDNR